MTGERLAGATPALVVLAAGVVVAVLCFVEARRIDRNAARGHRGPVRPHSAHTGTATADHKAIAHHDKEQQMPDLLLIRIDPIQEIAANAETLARFITALDPYTKPPQAAPELLALGGAPLLGWPLIRDDQVPAGHVHLRPVQPPATTLTGDA